MKKLLLFSTLLGWVFSTQGLTLTLGEYLKEVEENNPRVRSFYEAYEAKENLISPSLWPQGPTFTVNKMFMDRTVGLMQYIPFPVKLLKKREIAEWTAKGGYQDFRTVRLSVTTRAKTLFFEYVYVKKAIEVTLENIRNFEEILGVSQKKYETGGEIWEVLRTEVEIAKLENQLADLQAKERGIRAELNALRNLPPEEEIGELSLPDLEKIKLPPKETLKEIALSEQPVLHSQRAKVNEVRERVSLSRWNLFPDFATDFIYKGESNDWRFSLGFRVPLWFPFKELPLIKAREKSLESQKDLYQEMENATLKELEAVQAQWEAAFVRYRNYRKVIVPKALEALRVAEAGYISGRLDFLNLLNSETTYLVSEISLWRAYSHLGKCLALLESILGEDLWTRGDGS